VLAGALLLCCGVLLVRLCLPAPRRQQFDRRLQHGWTRLRLLVTGIPRHWVQRRRTQREAAEAIERARRRSAGSTDVQREGNVYRPDRFKPPADRDKLH
jgi:hypothetical protein